jgi:hypothetical protein
VSKVKDLEQQVRELREAVVAMAIALGAALPPTPEVRRAFMALTEKEGS